MIPAIKNHHDLASCRAVAPHPNFVCCVRSLYSHRCSTRVPMNILSIQSWVTYGHVGNASAVFPMQRLGCEVWAIHTVQFSNHTGYGAWTGRVFDGATIAELVDGIAARGVLPTCDGVLSGYMGSAEIGAAI